MKGGHKGSPSGISKKNLQFRWKSAKLCDDYDLEFSFCPALGGPPLENFTFKPAQENFKSRESNERLPEKGDEF